MEIADRLNAVGRDISILIQPMDLVKQLKKGLKSIKGYKDYIVMWYSPSLLVETHARVPFLYLMFFVFRMVTSYVIIILSKYTGQIPLWKTNWWIH